MGGRVPVTADRKACEEAVKGNPILDAVIEQRSSEVKNVLQLREVSQESVDGNPSFEISGVP